MAATQWALSVLSVRKGMVIRMANEDFRPNGGTGDASGPGRIEPHSSTSGRPGFPGSPGPGSGAGAGAGAGVGAGAGGGSSWGAWSNNSRQGGFGSPSSHGGHIDHGQGTPGAPMGAGGFGEQGGVGNGTAKKAKGIGALGIAALMLASAAVGGVTATIVTAGQSGSSPARDSEVTNALEEPGATRSEPAPEGSIEAAAQAALDSVVSIQVSTPRGTSSGSGSVLSSDGLVLTNQHVVGDAQQPGARMTVLLNDGTTHPAEYVAGHGPSDIAVIRVSDVNDLRPISLGDSSKVSVGQEVVAVGSPLGLTSTVTSGIVSALNRPVAVGGEGGESTVIDAIQTDAAINPGNSGGALVDLSGNLIGVPSVIASNGAGEEAGSIGLGFAIPVNQARRIADELIDQGSVQMPAINAAIDTRSQLPGALVGDVTPGGAAERGGLRPGDLVVKVDDRRVDSGIALIAAIRSRAVGDTVTLTVTDEDGRGMRTIDVTLEAARE